MNECLMVIEGRSRTVLIGDTNGKINVVEKMRHGWSERKW